MRRFKFFCFRVNQDVVSIKSRLMCGYYRVNVGSFMNNSDKTWAVPSWNGHGSSSLQYFCQYVSQHGHQVVCIYFSPLSSFFRIVYIDCLYEVTCWFQHLVRVLDLISVLWLLSVLRSDHVSLFSWSVSNWYFSRSYLIVIEIKGTQLLLIIILENYTDALTLILKLL